MNSSAPLDRHNDRSRILTVIGVLLLLVGLGCAALGPAELYCFYFFVEGGRFHYPGFGFGSFMFAFLAIQIIGYYVIAAVCIPLGCGHLRLRRWARTISLAGIGFWFIVGIPLVIVFMAVLVTSKEPSPTTVLAMLPVLALLYPVLPAALTRFYRSKDVWLTFEDRDPKSYWTEQLPLPLLVLCMLYVFFILVLHTAILLRGAFPLFGVLLTDLTGILFIDAAVLLLALLTWGTFKCHMWAWWGALLGFGLMTLSTIWTFARLGWAEILGVMQFAPTEVEALDGIPISGVHIAAFVGLPLAATLALIIYSRRFFGAGRPTAGTEKHKPTV
jgi:hypothetical protein